MMKLSISIVNYNSPELLETLKSIYEHIKEDFEVIIVDNHSKHELKQRIKQSYPQVKLIENNKNLGFAKAQNQGIKGARGRYTLLLNPDIKLQKDTIPKLIRFLELNPEANIVGCKLTNLDRSLQYSAKNFPTVWNSFCNRFLKVRNSQLLKDYSKIQKVDWLCGALLLMRKKYYFDERYFLYCEDIDLCRTVGGVYYYPKVYALHNANKESHRSAKRFVQHCTNLFRYFNKWGFKMF